MYYNKTKYNKNISVFGKRQNRPIGMVTHKNRPARVKEETKIGLNIYILYVGHKFVEFGHFGNPLYSFDTSIIMQERAVVNVHDQNFGEFIKLSLI